MRAAFLTAPETIELKTVRDLTCGSDEMLIRVMACGMCGSDVKIFRDGNKRVQFPATIGHEIAGIIVDKGSEVGDRFRKGDRVALGADIPCGVCHYCIKGSCNNCRENLAIGYQIPGGFAEFLKVDAKVWAGGPIQKIPEFTTFEEAALSEPLACAINGMEILPNQKKESMLIIGAGVLGCLLSELARIYGYTVIFLADTDMEKLAFVEKSGYGAEAYLPSDEELPDHVRALTQGHGVDAVVVACPDQNAQEKALHCVAPRGAINFFAGLAAGSPNLSVSSNLIHYNEIFVTGSHGSTPDQHRRAVEFIGTGRVRVKNLITHRFPLSDLAGAFVCAADSRKRLKVMVLPARDA